MLGVSVDSQYANNAFAKQIGVTFPLLSDFQRKVSKEYGILNPMGFANRTTFVINKEGIIQSIDKSADAISPSGAMQACSLIEHEKEVRRQAAHP